MAAINGASQAEFERVTMLGKWRWLGAVIEAPGASKAAIQVARALAEYWNAERGIAWPGQARLARECGCSERTIVKAVSWLVAHDLVAVIRRGRANAYSINWASAASTTPVERCRSASGKVKRSSPMKGEAEFTLLGVYKKIPSKNNNLMGALAEGEPHRGASVAGSPAPIQLSSVDKCGRTADQHEPPQSGFEGNRGWYESQEPDDDLPDLDEAWRQHDERPAPAYAPEPEPELPSRQIERQFGGKPPVGSKVHAIWRLQRRLEGVCRKVGQSPFAITDHSCDEGLEDLLDMQARNDSGLGRVLAEYAALDFHETAEFFEPRE